MNQKEVLNPTPKEINFYGEGLEYMINQGIKLVTIRLPHQKYDIPAGTTFDANCTDDGVIIPSIVFENKICKLNEVEKSQLWFDGYSNVHQAAKDLGKYYDDVSPDTLVQVVSFTTLERIEETLYESQKQFLLDQTFTDSINNPSMRRFFMPGALEWQLFHQPHTSITDWQHLTRDQLQIVSQKDLDSAAAKYPMGASLAMQFGRIDNIDFDYITPEETQELFNYLFVIEKDWH